VGRRSEIESDAAHRSGLPVTEARLLSATRHSSVPSPRPFSLSRREILLRYDEANLFAPNAVTRLLGKIIEITADDIVLDLGSGVGPLAIWAALQHSKEVHAVELLSEHCALLKENLLLNQVEHKVRIHQGDLFSCLPSGFQADVIIADVSGIAEEAGRYMGWYPPRVPTAGPDGTAVIVPLLRQSRSYLAPGGRLYFPVGIGMADSDKILNTARACFRKVEVLSQADFPLTAEQHAGVMLRLPAHISHGIRKRGARFVWSGLFCKATEPVFPTI
jgi:hypothetical protein